MKFFEDIRVGDVSEYGRYTFTADNIKTFAVRFDPQPFHVDEEQPRAQMVIAMNTGTAISFEQLRPHGVLSGWRTG